jgi:hypothetical protein
MRYNAVGCLVTLTLSLLTAPLAAGCALAASRLGG